jgi:hypothetical protein
VPVLITTSVKRYVSGPVIAGHPGTILALLEFTRQIGYRAVVLADNHRGS